MQPIGIKPGVYLNLDIETYHGDTAVSSSGIKKLINSAEKYWVDSPLNPNREKKQDTDALRLGKAYHAHLLEPHIFEQEFFVLQEGDPKKPSITQRNAAKPSPATLDAIEFWDNVVGNRAVLKPDEYKKMKGMRERMLEYKLIPLTISNGLAEVSVFWRDEETGLMCRCRFDYWRSGFITDYKTCQEIDKESQRDIFYDFPRYGYDISGAMYMEGARKLRDMISKGEGHIDPLIPENFLDDFMKQGTERFMFLYQEKEAPYEMQGRVLSVGEDTALTGMHKFRKGLDVYRDHIERFGAERWESQHPEIVDISIDNFSSTINFA